MKRTTNYALPTWEKSDFIQMSDFNDLTQKTDAALKANADAAASKADGAATSAALAALAKNLGVVGHNARVTWGSYTGAGTYGASNQNSLEFGFCPVLVAITCDELGHYPAAPSILLRGAGLAPTLTGGKRRLDGRGIHGPPPHMGRQRRQLVLRKIRCLPAQRIRHHVLLCCHRLRQSQRRGIKNSPEPFGSGLKHYMMFF